MVKSKAAGVDMIAACVFWGSKFTLIPREVLLLPPQVSYFELCLASVGVF